MSAAIAEHAKPWTDRWTDLVYHPVQAELWTSGARFRVVPAGRRSGKTELAKRFLVIQAMMFSSHSDGRFFLAAPTFDQARDIFWDDLVRLIPEWFIAKRGRTKAINENRMTIRLINGATIRVIGMDKPQRLEGKPIDGIVVDEIADCKPGIFKNHLRPALSTRGRLGWAWFIGVPEGRNHYYLMWKDATSGKRKDWAGFTWHAADIIDAEEIEAAKEELDPHTFRQEYEGEFLDYEGQAYHQFDPEVHAAGIVRYNPLDDLHLCFDFNPAPGVMAISHVRKPPQWLSAAPEDELIPCFFDEIWIERNSNTYKVCDRFLEKYKAHEGRIYVYGDASGGANYSSSVAGSDWELVTEKLRPVFGSRLRFRVPRKNPYVRPRLNSVNARLRNAAKHVRMAVDRNCQHTIMSLEGTTLDESGDIEKPPGDLVTHLSDALGYFIHTRWPCDGGNELDIDVA